MMLMVPAADVGSRHFRGPCHEQIAIAHFAILGGANAQREDGEPSLAGAP